MPTFISKSLLTLCSLLSLNLLSQTYAPQGHHLYHHFKQSFWQPSLNQVAFHVQQGALHCWYQLQSH